MPNSQCRLWLRCGLYQGRLFLQGLHSHKSSSIYGVTQQIALPGFCLWIPGVLNFASVTSQTLDLSSKPYGFPYWINFLSQICTNYQYKGCAIWKCQEWVVLGWVRRHNSTWVYSSPECTVWCFPADPDLWYLDNKCAHLEYSVQL